VTDPLFGQSYNRYSYVLNNPINLIDPTGFDFESSSSSGCGFEWSCTGGNGFDMYYSVSFGPPSGGGSSGPDQSSGVKIASSTPKHAVRLPAGTSVASGTRSGPTAQSWSAPNGADFHNQLNLDLAQQIAYNNALWEAGAHNRMRRMLSTHEQDEEQWRREGRSGEPPIGYAHDALIYSLNAGHGIGVEQVSDAAVVVGAAGTAWNAGKAGFGMLRAAFAAGAEEGAAAAKGVASVATGAGRDIAEGSIVREIAHGEKVKDLISEVAGRTYELNREQAIVSLNDGARVIIEGGSEGIRFGQFDVRRVLLHTHPYTTGPSIADKLMLGAYGQRSSWVYELFGGGLSRFRAP
jgi:hypothetical protein